MKPTSRNRVIATMAALVVAAVLSACQPPPPTAHDGSTSAASGASCWGIKQQYPATPSGVRWLLTPAMDRPVQAYCDMATDGGGWELLGRGRQDWTFAPTGQGSPSAVRNAVDGPAAFVPAALSNDLVRGLLNRAQVRGLPDGIRVERAVNSAGSQRQEIRMFPRLAGEWTWEFPGGQPLDHIVLDGQSYAGSNTRDTYDAEVYGQSGNGLAGQQGTNRMFTFGWEGNAYRQGFELGYGVPGGSNDPSDYLWSTGQYGYQIPFARVWVRPMIANTVSGFAAIPSGGYAAAPLPPNLKDSSERAPWGVVGLDHTNEELVDPWRTNVVTVKASRSQVFVGGRFTGVQPGPGGAVTNQASLAAFDLDGNWVPSFRPAVAGRVWDIIVTSDNKVVIAGDFTSVNGAPGTSGIAKLDPVTGAVVPGFKANAANSDGSPFRVRALDQRGGWIYAAGYFDRFTGGASSPLAVKGAISLRASDGSPGSWRPRLNGGSAVRIQVTNAGDRVLMAGHFTTVNDDAFGRSFAITDLATGNLSAGIGPWTPPAGAGSMDFQQAVADLGDRIVVGGSQHDTQLWNRDRTSMLDSAITKAGGDTQMIEVFGTKAFVSCHCGDVVYTGTNDFLHPNNFRAAEPINLVTSWDTRTWQHDTTWYPVSLKGAFGEGVWTADQDSRGCLWVGGDLVRGAYSGDAGTDYLGGFARFCAIDATSPTAPSALTLKSSGAARTLTWKASTDAGGGLLYDVYRNDRVIATVTGTTYTDASAPAGTRYTVRAADGRGNRSASPAPVTVP